MGATLGSDPPGLARVAVRRAPTYEAPELHRAVAAALGSLETHLPARAKVFVKVNHLSPPSPPERGIITHPTFTAAVLAVLTSITPHITVGDDLHASTPDGFEVSGYRAMCARLGVRLVNLRETGFVRVSVEGRVLKEIYLAREAVEADVVVNLPKLKTHSLTLFTGAVKNMYGLIPGGLRVALHGQYKNPGEFNEVLVDIFSAARPHLTIMDGIVAMEGAGPANGALRQLGLILASHDAVAVDTVACRIIGLDPLAVGTSRCARERGLGVADLDRIEVVGETIAAVSVPDFRLPPLPAGAIVGRAPRVLTRFVTNQISVRPRVVPRACVGCGACARICPTGAATVVNGVARTDRRTCIRCMCCHEVCRYGAIAVGRSAVGQAIYPLVRARRRVRRQA